MENTDDQEVKIVKFIWWDWFILICGILFVLFGLFLLSFKNNDGVGPLVWGLVIVYYKVKKFKKSKK